MVPPTLTTASEATKKANDLAEEGRRKNPVNFEQPFIIPALQRVLYENAPPLPPHWTLPRDGIFPTSPPLRRSQTTGAAPHRAPSPCPNHTEPRVFGTAQVPPHIGSRERNKRPQVSPETPVWHHCLSYPQCAVYFTRRTAVPDAALLWTLSDGWRELRGRMGWDGIVSTTSLHAF